MPEVSNLPVTTEDFALKVVGIRSCNYKSENFDE